MKDLMYIVQFYFKTASNAFIIITNENKINKELMYIVQLYFKTVSNAFVIITCDFNKACIPIFLLKGSIFSFSFI